MPRPDTDAPEDRFAGFRDASRRGRGPFAPRGAQHGARHGPGGGPAGEGPREKSSRDRDAKGEISSDGTTGSSEEISSWKQIRSCYEEGEKGKARLEAARRCHQERSFLLPRGTEELWVWDSGAGIYREEGRAVLEGLLAEKLGRHHSTHEVRQVLAKVKAEAPADRLGEARVIPLEEIDVLPEVYPTGKVVFRPTESSAEHRVGTRINVPWRPKAEPRVFDDFLREAVPSGEDRQVIRDYAGYILMHWARPFRRALVLVGPEESGIAPIMEILSWLCARVSSVRPSRLARGRSRTLSPEAWANICYGADPEALARLPLLSGPMLRGSPAEASSTESTSPEAASGSPRAAKHIYSATGLPPLAAGDPFFQKVLLAACPETLGAEERGPGLRRALWEERGGILQWALEGLRRVLQSAQAGEGFPSGRPVEATRRRWDSMGGPIGRFKEAYLEVTGAPEDLVVKRRLYEAYKGFCQREGVLAKMIDRFTPALTDDPLIGSDRRVPEPGADQVRCYIGAKPKRPLDDLIAEARG